MELWIQGGDTGWSCGYRVEIRGGEKKDELRVEIVDTGQIRSYWVVSGQSRSE